ncbi:MAG TPA: hypothetical protein VJ576_12910 [Rhodocyclaceae bacterium]|nr:hypothetical protein [Rhodocyclaceae bacterium]
MRIQESDVRLASRHEQDYRHEIETRGATTFRNVFRDVATPPADEAQGERERVMRLLQSLVDAILGALDGKKCRTEIADCQDLPPLPQSRQVEREIDWQWESTESIRDHERTQVEGSGVIRTAEGKSIDFSLSLDMCRDYSCERKYEESGKVVLHDPLVINFDGQAADLGGRRFAFDLDSDGKVERLPGLGAGSGFLVLDRNGNGRVDDGGELFGAASGDGFADLAKLDADRNGWLDEADPEFVRLQVWAGGEDKGALAGLGQKGVGALWLGAADSPFALKDKANRLLGEIRATGVYLAEDGRVGSLQQVDLATEPEEAKTA